MKGCDGTNLLLGTTHWAEGPQKTLTKASWDGEEETCLLSPPVLVWADLTAR